MQTKQAGKYLYSFEKEWNLLCVQWDAHYRGENSSVSVFFSLLIFIWHECGQAKPGYYIHISSAFRHCDDLVQGDPHESILIGHLL